MKSLSILPLALLIGGATLLGGCKLSDLTDDDEDGPTLVLQGRAAAGGPLVGATIDIRDASGQQYRVYSNASGYFSLSLDEDDFARRAAAPVVGLRAPVVVRATANSTVYHSVLCNVVYGEGDSVNVHPLTDYVMNETAAVDDNTLDNWSTRAGDYCDEEFNEVFRGTAATLGSNFNFFNSAFKADETGFDAILASFNHATFSHDAAPADFRIANGLGSLVLIPGTRWAGHATGTFGGDAVNEYFNGELSVGASGLRDRLEALLENQAEPPVSVSELVIVLEGDGTGEIGTTVRAVMRGKASVDGASLITRNFNVTLELERQLDSGDEPL